MNVFQFSHFTLFHFPYVCSLFHFFTLLLIFVWGRGRRGWRRGLRSLWFLFFGLLSLLFVFLLVFQRALGSCRLFLVIKFVFNLQFVSKMTGIFLNLGLWECLVAPMVTAFDKNGVSSLLLFFLLKFNELVLDLGSLCDRGHRLSALHSLGWRCSIWFDIERSRWRSVNLNSVHTVNFAELWSHARIVTHCTWVCAADCPTLRCGLMCRKIGLYSCVGHILEQMTDFTGVFSGELLHRANVCLVNGDSLLSGGVMVLSYALMRSLGSKFATKRDFFGHGCLPHVSGLPVVFLRIYFRLSFRIISKG